MKANTTPGKPRLALAQIMTFAIAVGLPIGGIALATGLTSPAWADERPALAATSAPFAALVSPGLMVETTSAQPAAAGPEYHIIGSGVASYYGRELAGNRTASGERFDPTELTAAHRTLPLGSQARITNPRTGKSVIVRINDRGPFHSNRLIDLSEAAAREIGIRAAGKGVVEIAVEAE